MRSPSHIMSMFILAATLILPRVFAANPPGLDFAPCSELCFTDALKLSNCSASRLDCLCSDDTIFSDLVACAQGKCMPRETLVTVNMTSIACNAPIRDESQKMVHMAIAFLCVTSLIFGLRIYQRFFLSSGLYWDDYLIIFSYLCGIPSTVILIVGLVGNGSGRDAWTLSFDNITGFLYVLYFTQVFTVKLSILAFYLRLFPGVLIRRLIWGTIAVTCALIVIYDLVTIFQCRPVTHYWLGWDKESEGHCLSVNALVWANAASSIVLDCWMLGLPLSQLRRLQLNWKKKVGVGLMFSVGVFVTAISVLRLQFLVYFSNSTNPTWDQFQTSYWSTIELNVSVCCACMPSLRLILERLFPRALGSTRDRLHDSPISLSRHDRALRSANPDPTSKILYSREFQVEYCTDGDDSEAAGGNAVSRSNSGWKRGDIP